MTTHNTTPAAAIAYTVRYLGGQSRHAVMNRQTNKTVRVPIDYSIDSDNYARHAAEIVHGGPVVYAGDLPDSKIYVGF